MSQIPITIFVGAFVSGLFLGIYFQTGISIDPADLTMKVGGEIVNATGNPTTKSMWQTYSILFLLVGIIGTISEMVAIYLLGPIHLISMILGFVAGLLLILIPSIGVWFLIGGVLFSKFFSPE
jgi:hypothetical protein